MIKANELRVGNFIIWDNPILNIKEQVQINWEDFELITNKNLGNKYHPIPLITDILEKCGFEHKDVIISGKRYWKKKTEKFNLVYIEGDNEISISFFDKKLSAQAEYCLFIYFLHQLQNLYFALTGEELTYQI